jgi:hypothetical protein
MQELCIFCLGSTILFKLHHLYSKQHSLRTKSALVGHASLAVFFITAPVNTKKLLDLPCKFYLKQFVQ